MGSRGEKIRNAEFGMRNEQLRNVILLIAIVFVLASPAAAQLSDPLTVWGYAKNDTGAAAGGLNVTLALANASTPCVLTNQLTASDGSYSYDLSSCAGGYWRNDTVELNVTNAAEGSFGYARVMIPPNGSLVQAPNMTLRKEPQWKNAGQNRTFMSQSDAILLFAQGVDGGNLTSATLATNETGTWQNWSGKYGSPINFAPPNNSRWLWSNFTWQNASVSGSVGWRIYYQDNEGRTNNTSVRNFTVSAGGPVIRVVNQSSPPVPPASPTTPPSSPRSTPPRTAMKLSCAPVFTPKA